MSCFVQTPDGTLPVLQKTATMYSISRHDLLNVHQHVCAFARLRQIVGKKMLFDAVEIKSHQPNIVNTKCCKIVSARSRKTEWTMHRSCSMIAPIEPLMDQAFICSDILPKKNNNNKNKKQ